MECYEAEEMVSGYINNTLKTADLEKFLEHVRKCPSCYDELEMHFIVNEAINRLSEEGETALDFKVLLEQDLKQAERHVLRLRLQKVLILWALITVLILAVFFGLYTLFT